MSEDGSGQIENGGQSEQQRMEALYTEKIPEDQRELFNTVGVAENIKKLLLLASDPKTEGEEGDRYKQNLEEYTKRLWGPVSPLGPEGYKAKRGLYNLLEDIDITDEKKLSEFIDLDTILLDTEKNDLKRRVTSTFDEETANRYWPSLEYLAELKYHRLADEHASQSLTDQEVAVLKGHVSEMKHEEAEELITASDFTLTDKQKMTLLEGLPDRTERENEEVVVSKAEREAKQEQFNKLNEQVGKALEEAEKLEGETTDENERRKIRDMLQTMRSKKDDVWKLAQNWSAKGFKALSVLIGILYLIIMLEMNLIHKVGPAGRGK